MKISITLNEEQRKTLLHWYRRSSEPQLRLRCHIILLLAEGYTWAGIAAILFCSSRTIDRWQKRFLQGGTEALLGQRRGRPPCWDSSWLAVIKDWVLRLSPRDFGFWRSRWCCAVVALLLRQRHDVDVCAETVRRWMHRANLVWGRPRPALKRSDPDKEAKIAAFRQLMLTLPEDETLVFEDEVDVQLNPQVGFAWMERGRQSLLLTPGDNETRYMAGSLHWRTGQMFTTVGPKRDGKLFVRHLDQLRKQLRRYKKIHVILDNASFHDCWEVWEFYQQYFDRFEFHFLPKYAPELNPIERVWWHLREEVTRNHQCQSIEELVDFTLGWLTNRRPFQIETPQYRDLMPQ